MTERFNLLPARYVERMAERRSAGVVAAALVGLIAVLGVVSVAQGHRLGAAQAERSVEQARTVDLQAQRKALAPYRQLADGIVGRERLLAAAMGTQVSWAATLDSLASAFPAGAALTSLTAESTLLAFGAVTPPPAPSVDLDRVIGSTDLKGYSVESFTPGVERMLQLLDAVTGLSEPRLQLGADELIGERPVTTFEGSTFIDQTALTGRYAEGLPPESDVEVPVLGAGAPTTPRTAAPAPPTPAPAPRVAT